MMEKKITIAFLIATLMVFGAVAQEGPCDVQNCGTCDVVADICTGCASTFEKVDPTKSFCNICPG